MRALDLLDTYRTVLLTILAAIMFGVGVWYFREDLRSLLEMIKSDQAHPALLVGGFLILPMLFFPVTILLVLIGIRFDAAAGILIMFMVMPVHLMIAFFVVRSMFRSRLERLARKKRVGFVHIPADRQLEFAFVFMIVPGLPYAVKNYLLPLSGLSFRDYFFIGWLINGILGIPFVVIGHAASQWNLHVILTVLALLVIAYAIAKQVRKRYARPVDSTSDR